MNLSLRTRPAAHELMLARCAHRSSIACLLFAVSFAGVLPSGASAQLQSAAEGRAVRLLVDSAITLHKQITAGRKERGSAGTLVADGDSWFDYPSTDLLHELEVLGYAIESISHYGKTIEGIALSPEELSRLADKMEKVKASKVTPKAILLSAGGNDIAGAVLGVVLNNRATAPPQIDAILMKELINNRIKSIMLRWVYATSELSRRTFGVTVPIVIQGYDYPVPDGRGFSKYWFTWAGPWLKPEFDARGYADAPDTALRCAYSLMSSTACLLQLQGTWECRMCTMST